MPEIFIGSSTKGLSIAREVELQLISDATVRLWTNGVFLIAQGTLEALLVATHNVDFAIMILTPDDMLLTRGRSYATPRDNVLFELGLFMGSLGRRRTFMLSEDRANLRLPSDLAGITRATFRKQKQQTLSQALAPACTRIIERIHDEGKRPPEERNEDFHKFLKLGMYMVDYPLYYEDLRDLLATSTEITVLKTWFPENKVIEEGLEHAIMKRSPRVKLKLLLCKPDSLLLQQRSQSALHRKYQGSSVVYQTIQNIHNWLREKSALKRGRSAGSRHESSVEIRCYDSWPGCPMIWCDDKILMGFYFRGAPSPEWPWISVRKESWLAKRLEAQFWDLWKESDTRLETATDRARWLKENRRWEELEPSPKPRREPSERPPSRNRRKGKG